MRIEANAGLPHTTGTTFGPFNNLFPARPLPILVLRITGYRERSGQEVTMQRTVCPCGNRLTEAQVKAGGKYCSVGHKGKYHKDPPRERGFGIEVPTVKRFRLAVGYRAFLGEG